MLPAVPATAPGGGHGRLLLAALLQDPGAATAGGAAPAAPFPGPAPWGPSQWAGAAFYLVLFLAGLWGAWILVRGAPGGPDEGSGPEAPPPEAPGTGAGGELP